VVAVVGQPPDLASQAVELSGRQVRLAHGRAGDSERGDGI